ncbi:MAG: 50S ribosomal protein L15 [Treponema sp.]|nr:50S ribosomal protein L15 [Treponema sp.]
MAHDFNLRAPEGANKRKRILGRGQGSGRGTTSGKGNKGQQARSGGKTYGGFEGGQMPLYRRLAQRGFSNYPFKKSFQIVNLVDIDKRYNDGETVSELSLYDKGLIKGRKKGGAFAPASPVKILANGDLTKKLVFKIDAVSGSAKEKIQKAGGELAASAEKSAAESSAQ